MEVAVIFCLLLCCVFIVAITWLGERVRDAEAKLHEHFAEIDLLKAKYKALETWLSNLHDVVAEIKSSHIIKEITMQSWQNPCADPNIPCMNPHHDCVNCPRTGSGSIGSFTSTSIETNNKQE